MTKLFFAFIYLISFSSPAFAYLDPGLGSMLIQGLLAVIATGAVYFSIYWKKFKDFIKKFSKKKKPR